MQLRMSRPAAGIHVFVLVYTCLFDAIPVVIMAAPFISSRYLLSSVVACIVLCAPVGGGGQGADKPRTTSAFICQCLLSAVEPPYRSINLHDALRHLCLTVNLSHTTVGPLLATEHQPPPCRIRRTPRASPIQSTCPTISPAPHAPVKPHPSRSSTSTSPFQALARLREARRATSTFHMTRSRPR